MNKETNIGFSPEKEEKFLKRLPDEIRRVNLDQELRTQLAEDFGLVEFTLKYRFNEKGKIVDLKSGSEIAELTSRGGIEEEIEAINKIENGLRTTPDQTWVHFSPKNEELSYPENCVDFWRVINGTVIWNRIVVKNDFSELNKTRKFLSGEDEAKDEMELLKSPIAVDLKLANIFDFFRLAESKNITNLKEIEEVVDDYLDEFNDNFGSKLTKDSGLIFALYSACYRKIELGNINLRDYMYGVRKNITEEKSFGCAVSTRVGEFGEKIGYFVTEGGKVSYGTIPEGFKECKKCGCWYTGDKCPFC
jgi:hypothetical protein